MEIDLYLPEELCLTRKGDLQVSSAVNGWEHYETGLTICIFIKVRDCIKCNYKTYKNKAYKKGEKHCSSVKLSVLLFQFI